MSKKVFIAEQETLLEVQEQVEKLVRNLVPDDAPIYGMVIHLAFPPALALSSSVSLLCNKNLFRHFLPRFQHNITLYVLYLLILLDYNVIRYFYSSS